MTSYTPIDGKEEDENLLKPTPHLTILETLNNRQTWLFLTLPVALFLLTSFLPFNVDRTDLFTPSSSCPALYSHCEITGHSLSFETGPIMPLQFIQLSIVFPGVFMENFTASSVLAETFVYYKSRSRPLSHSITDLKLFSELFYNRTVPAVLEVPLYYSSFCNPLEANSYQDRSVIVKVLFRTFAANEEEIKEKPVLAEVLRNAEIISTTGNPYFPLVDAVVMIAFAVITIRVLIYAISRIVGTLPQKKFSGCTIFLGHVKAEQFYALVMCVFLVCWLDPLSAMAIIETNLTHDYLSDKVHGISQILRSFSFEGILFCSYILIDCLCLVDKGLEERVEEMLAGQPSGLSRTESPRLLEQFEREASWWSDKPPAKQESNWWSSTTESTKLVEREPSPSRPFAGRHRESWASPSRKPHRRVSLGLHADHQANADIHSDFKLMLPVYHPRSPLILEAIGWPVFCLFLTWMVTFGYWTLQFPHSLGYSNPNEQERPMWNMFCSVLYVAYVGCIWGWVIAIFRALRLSKRKLEKIPYLRSRFQQILCQILSIQWNIALCVVLIGAVLQIYSACRVFHMDWHTNLRAVSSGHWWSFFVLFLQFAFGAWLNETGNRMGLEVYISTLILLIVVAVSPAAVTTNPSRQNSDDAAASEVLGEVRQEILTCHSFYTLERHVPESQSMLSASALHLSSDANVNVDDHRASVPRSSLFHEVVHSFASSSQKELFCLETACRLLEVSYQAYFTTSGPLVEKNASRPASGCIPNLNVTDAGRLGRERSFKNSRLGRTTSNTKPTMLKISRRSSPSKSPGGGGRTAMASGPKLDLSRLGYQLHGVIENDITATFGLIGLSDSEIVIAFRGSVYENVYTDMKFGAMPLPEMKLSRLFFIEMLEAADIEPLSRPQSDEVEKPDHDRQEKPKFAASSESSDDHDQYHKALEVSTDKSNEDLPSSTTDKRRRSSNNLVSLSVESGKKPIRDPSDPKGPSTNLGCWKKLVTMLPVAGNALPQVHTGFWEAYNSIRKEFLHSLTIGLRSWQRSRRMNAAVTLNDEFPPSKIVFCGHSLGGALAQLAALDVSINLKAILRAIRSVDDTQPYQEQSYGTPSFAVDLPNPTLSVYVFGSPRVGNALFSRLINRLVEVLYRVEMEGDLVTMVPPTWTFYKHAGISVLVDPTEIGSLIVNPTVVEQFLIHKSTIVPANHMLDNYRSSLEACFTDEEYDEYLAKESLLLSI